jgi:hypothetical protein
VAFAQYSMSHDLAWIVLADGAGAFSYESGGLRSSLATRHIDTK